MKSSEILRKAAREFERGNGYSGLRYMTGVVSGYIDAEYGTKTELRASADRDRAMTYVRQVAPVKARSGTYWFGPPAGGYWKNDSPQDLRILAACFAACLAEDEGD